MGENMTPADIKAVVGDNNAYPYPPYMYGGGFGNSGFGDGGWLWLILILAVMGGWGNNNGFGGGFGGNSDYAWLSNGQKEIMQNTNDGFNTLQLANQLTGINSGVQNLSTQLCNCCADINATVNSGFANAETSANSRQMANMQQAFSNQLSTLQGFNGVTSQLAEASADNRLGIANLGSDIAREACATRTSDTQNTQTLLTAITGGIQSIKDQICQDKIDSKNEKIADLQRELQMADLRASQIAQTAQIRAGQETANTELLNLLNTCPIPSTPVFGRTPIFTCNSGCGCGNAYGNTIV